MAWLILSTAPVLHVFLLHHPFDIRGGSLWDTTVNIHHVSELGFGKSVDEGLRTLNSNLWLKIGKIWVSTFRPRLGELWYSIHTMIELPLFVRSLLLLQCICTPVGTHDTGSGLGLSCMTIFALGVIYTAYIHVLECKKCNIYI